MLFLCGGILSWLCPKPRQRKRYGDKGPFLGDLGENPIKSGFGLGPRERAWQCLLVLFLRPFYAREGVGAVWWIPRDSLTRTDVINPNVLVEWVLW